MVGTRLKKVWVGREDPEMLQKKSPGGVEEEGLKRKREEMLGTDCGIQRYLVTVEYIGTRFLGFQKQKNMRTVQGVLEVISQYQEYVGCELEF